MNSVKIFHENKKELEIRALFMPHLYFMLCALFFMYIAAGDTNFMLCALFFML
jgi:hypothetical protein